MTTQGTFIDLTHTFEEELSRFGNLPNPIIRCYLTHEESVSNFSDGCSFEITEVRFVTSIGTYLDAPRHRYKDGRDISQLKLPELILQGFLIDQTKKKAGDPITKIDIEKELPTKKRGVGAAVIWTGWDKYWKTEQYKNGPYLEKGAVIALLRHGVKLVGIDTLNIDDFRNPARPAHTLLLGSNCLIVENLRGLARLKGTDFEFAALPVKVKGAASFPVRAFARVTATHAGCL